jgi:hypothetical protein
MNAFCMKCKREMDAGIKRMVSDKLSCRCGEIINYKRFRSGNIQIQLKLVGESNGKRFYDYGVSLRYRSILCVGNDFVAPFFMSDKQVAVELIYFLIQASDSIRSELGWNFTSEEIFEHSDAIDGINDTEYHVVEDILYEDCYMIV